MTTTKTILAADDENELREARRKVALAIRKLLDRPVWKLK